MFFIALFLLLFLSTIAGVSKRILSSSGKLLKTVSRAGVSVCVDVATNSFPILVSLSRFYTVVISVGIGTQDPFLWHITCCYGIILVGGTDKVLVSDVSFDPHCSVIIVRYLKLCKSLSVARCGSGANIVLVSGFFTKQIISTSNVTCHSAIQPDGSSC